MSLKIIYRQIKIKNNIINNRDKISKIIINKTKIIINKNKGLSNNKKLNYKYNNHNKFLLIYQDLKYNPQVQIN
jgi:hypothetical protein